MKLLDENIFKGVLGEQVTVEILPKEIPNLCSASLDGIPVQQSGILSFAISRPRHYLELKFDFLPDSPATASYDVLVAGSNGGQFPITVRKGNPALSRLLVLTFIGDTGPK
jgi:hypothetical protein